MADIPTLRLPYEPVAFMHTETIGVECSRVETQGFQFTVTDILLPSLLSETGMYTLFHTPPIYNWLRTIHSPESRVLSEYVRGASKKGQPFKCSHHALLGFLRKYVGMWEIVRLCWSGRVYVKDCGCSHVCKKELNSLEYTYHHATRSFRCEKIFCKQCGVDHQGKLDVIKMPPYLALETYYGDRMEGGYEVVMAFMIGEVYIRAANTMWYQVGGYQQDEQVRIVQFNKIPFKKAVSVIYAQPLPCLPILKKAVPFEVIEVHLREVHLKEEQNDNIRVQPSKHDRLLQKKEKEKQKQKQKEKEKEKKKKSKKKKSKEDRSERWEQLNELNLVSNQLVLPPSLKSGRQYSSGVMGLFVEQKIKDAYQLQYDRGKQRKVKEKKTYLKPDFNKVFAHLKEERRQPQAWKEKEREEYDQYDFKKKK